MADHLLFGTLEPLLRVLPAPVDTLWMAYFVAAFYDVRVPSEVVSTPTRYCEKDSFDGEG